MFLNFLCYFAIVTEHYFSKEFIVMLTYHHLWLLQFVILQVYPIILYLEQFMDHGLVSPLV